MLWAARASGASLSALWRLPLTRLVLHMEQLPMVAPTRTRLVMPLCRICRMALDSSQRKVSLTGGLQPARKVVIATIVGVYDISFITLLLLHDLRGVSRLLQLLASMRLGYVSVVKRAAMSQLLPSASLRMQLMLLPTR